MIGIQKFFPVIRSIMQPENARCHPLTAERRFSVGILDCFRCLNEGGGMRSPVKGGGGESAHAQQAVKAGEDPSPRPPATRGASVQAKTFSLFFLLGGGRRLSLRRPSVAMCAGRETRTQPVAGSQDPCTASKKYPQSEVIFHRAVRRRRISFLRASRGWLLRPC